MVARRYIAAMTILCMVAMRVPAIDRAGVIPLFAQSAGSCDGNTTCEPPITNGPRPVAAVSVCVHDDASGHLASASGWEGPGGYIESGMNYWVSDQTSALSFSFSYVPASGSCPAPDDSHWTILAGSNADAFASQTNADAASLYSGAGMAINTDNMSNSDDHFVTMAHEAGHLLGFGDLSDGCQGQSVMAQHNWHMSSQTELCADYNAAAQISGTVGQSGSGSDDYIPNGDCYDVFHDQRTYCYNADVIWLCGETITYSYYTCDPPSE